MPVDEPASAGRWESGDKRDYRFVGAAMAELGCVAVVANYRMYPAVKLPGFMEDAARADRKARQTRAIYEHNEGELA